MLWSEKQKLFLGFSFLPYGDVWWESKIDHITIRVKYSPKYMDNCTYVWEYEDNDILVRHKAYNKELARIAAEKFYQVLYDRRFNFTKNRHGIMFPVIGCMLAGNGEKIEI